MKPISSKDTITETTTSSAPKGLAAMFGGAVKYPATKSTKAGVAVTTTVAADQDLAGGSWRSVTSKRKGGLATKARLAGKQVTVTSSPVKTPIDDDQDISMGGMGKKKKPKRFSPYAGRKKPVTNAPVQQPVEILIHGFEPGTEAGVINFLQIKSKKQWQPLDCKVEGGQMLLTVDGNVLAGILTRLDGYMLGTQQIHIRLYQSDPSSSQPIPDDSKRKLTTIDHLRTFLKSRWNKDAGFLNLESMHTDPFLRQHGIRPPGDNGATPVVGPAMMKLAGEMFQGDILTVSFAKNRLHNVQPISTVAQYLPNLLNLSLQDNNIKAMEGLEALSGTGKLPLLRELVMAGNPLIDSEFKKYGNHRGYLRNVVKRFPSLVLLDGQPVSLSEEEAQSIQKTGKVLPLDTKHGFFDSEQTQAVATAFITNYYALFDASPEQRLVLQNIYDDHATFSITTLLRLRSHQKIRRKEKKKMMQDDDDALEWPTLNRNLKLKNQAKGLIMGREAIGETLRRLPPTMHDFNNTKEFVMDAHQTPAGLIVTIHGEFKEDERSPPYSFDRTFLLHPSVPGSVSAATGSEWTVITDTLNVRDYIGNQGFQPLYRQPTQSVFAL